MTRSIEQQQHLHHPNNQKPHLLLTDDFYLSLCVTEEIIKIKLCTKYDFQFAKRIKEFSVMDFLKTLIER